MIASLFGFKATMSEDATLKFLGFSRAEAKMGRISDRSARLKAFAKSLQRACVREYV